MGNGALIMNSDDILIIKTTVEEAITPLGKRMDEFNSKLDDLPCGDHSISINTLETQREATKEQKKETKDLKDLFIKVAAALVGLAGLLYTIGFFRSLAK